MNTKSSATVGWIAYTAAFVIGGGIGIYKYQYAPGGRRDREKAADEQRRKEEAMEAEEEARIRAERLQQNTTVTPLNPSLPSSAEAQDKNQST